MSATLSVEAITYRIAAASRLRDEGIDLLSHWLPGDATDEALSEKRCARCSRLMSPASVRPTCRTCRASESRTVRVRASTGRVCSTCRATDRSVLWSHVPDRCNACECRARRARRRARNNPTHQPVTARPSSGRSRGVPAESTVAENPDLTPSERALGLSTASPSPAKTWTPTLAGGALVAALRGGSS